MPSHIRFTGDVSYAYLRAIDHEDLTIHTAGALLAVELLDYSGVYGGLGFGLGILYASGRDTSASTDFSRALLYDPIFLRIGIERLFEPKLSLGVEVTAAAVGFGLSIPQAEGSIDVVARWM